MGLKTPIKFNTTDESSNKSPSQSSKDHCHFLGKWNIQTQRAPLMALYVGIKMPLLIFLTLTVNWLHNGLLATRTWEWIVFSPDSHRRCPSTPMSPALGPLRLGVLLRVRGCGLGNRGIFSKPILTYLVRVGRDRHSRPHVYWRCGVDS